jgi:hypothetical protein
MPKIIYDKILGEPLLYTNIYLQLTDQTLCYPERVLEDAIIKVEQSYVPVDFDPIHSAYNPSFSACFFSQNNIFLLQQISQ